MVFSQPRAWQYVTPPASRAAIINTDAIAQKCRRYVGAAFADAAN